ncbi:MAG TPA: GNAT family N-acetyltransferase [Actinomycetota bacterium]|nr:GNAT family N-acetyltransferase [Actinomycetota bacterium]
MKVRSFVEDDRPWATELLSAHMGSARVALRGSLYEPLSQPGFVAMDGGSPVGLLTVLEGPQWWEILTLHAAEPGRGVGTLLIGALADAARRAGLGRLRVVTTNDNLDALRFYQRAGFRLVELRAGAVDRSRATLKPEIPPTGLHGIPIRDEVELEKLI